MKKITTILTVLFIAISGIPANTYAQFNNPEDIYTSCEIGGGYGNFQSFHINLDVIINQYDIFTIGFNYHTRLAPQIPVDFKPEHISLGGDLDAPTQDLKMVSFMYGKVFYTRSRFLRFIARTGISMGNCNQPTDFKPVDVNYSGGFFGPSWNANYKWKEENRFIGGFVINPVIEFPLLRGFGLNIGLNGNINNVASIFSLEAGLTFGHLRDRIEKKISTSHLIGK